MITIPVLAAGAGASLVATLGHGSIWALLRHITADAGGSGWRG